MICLAEFMLAFPGLWLVRNASYDILPKEPLAICLAEFMLAFPSLWLVRNASYDILPKEPLAICLAEFMLAFPGLWLVRNASQDSLLVFSADKVKSIGLISVHGCKSQMLILHFSKICQ